jgi:hypothetical protein
MCRMMLIMIVIQNAIHYFFTGSPSEEQLVPKNETFQVSTKHFQNILRPKEHFDFDVYLSYYTPY